MDSFFWQMLGLNPVYAMATAFVNTIFTWDVLDVVLLGVIITLIIWPFSVLAVEARKRVLKKARGWPAYLASMIMTGALVSLFLALVPAVQGSWVATDRLGQLVMIGFLLGVLLKKPGERFRRRLRKIMTVPEPVELFIILITFDIIVMLAGAGLVWLAVYLGV